MGCGSSAAGGGKNSYKPTYLQKKKDFLRQKKVTHLKMIQDLDLMAKQIMDFNKNPEKVLENIKKFNKAQDVLGGNDITKPISDCIQQIPETMEPVVKKLEKTLERMQDDADQFRKRMGKYVEAIDDMFKLIKQAEKGKVVDKPKRYLNACRLLEYLVTQIEQEIEARDFGDKHVPLLEILKALVLIQKIGKSVSTIVKLCEKKIPLVGKCVKDYLETGGSNPVVSMAKTVIKKLTEPIRKRVQRVTAAATSSIASGFPFVEPQSDKFVGLKVVKKGKNLDVQATLPSKFATLEVQMIPPQMAIIHGEGDQGEEEEDDDEEDEDAQK